MNINFKSGGSVVINGKTYAGGSICINGDSITVDGSVVDTMPDKQITVTVHGDVRKLETSSGDVRVTGSVGDVKTVSGDVVINGDVDGDVGTVSGDVKSHKIVGNVKTVSGSVIGLKG